MTDLPARPNTDDVVKASAAPGTLEKSSPLLNVAWAPDTEYKAGEIATIFGDDFLCVSGHRSRVFGNDFYNDRRWRLLVPAGRYVRAVRTARRG